ncbi:chemotaxis protein CheB [Flavitalea flava]
MKQIKLIVIGGSAGSLQVLLNILSVIPANFPIPMLVVLHRNSAFESSLEELLASKTKAIIKEVEEKDAVTAGTIYICPADYHVLIEKEHSFSLDYSERVNYSRPSIDVTFRSAADAYGEGLACILLSGGNADGAEGLEYAKIMGGMTIVQDPASADVSYMPEQAIARTTVDHILPAMEIPGFISRLGLAF